MGGPGWAQDGKMAHPVRFMKTLSMNEYIDLNYK